MNSKSRPNRSVSTVLLINEEKTSDGANRYRALLASERMSTSDLRSKMYPADAIRNTGSMTWIKSMVFAASLQLGCDASATHLIHFPMQGRPYNYGSITNKKVATETPRHKEKQKKPEN